MRWWVGLWDRREGAVSLALIRILLAFVVFYDLFSIAYHGLPLLLWAPKELGGVHDILSRSDLPLWFRWFGHSSAAVFGLYITVVASLLAFGAGFLTRFSGLIFLLSYAQTAIINDQADRGIDRMIRIVVLLLIFSQSGRALSLDAKRKTGSFFGDGRLIPSWPRYLIVIQLVVMYWCAGVEKFAVSWYPWGGYSALYTILQDPIFATLDFSFLGSPWLYPLTQLATGVSHLWEWTFPVMLLCFYYRDTRSRPGRLRHFFLKWDVRLGYVLMGLIFHISLALTLRLGIFPAAMLALYPAFFHPKEIAAFFSRFRRPSTR
jgi:hypothetical protein